MIVLRSLRAEGTAPTGHRALVGTAARTVLSAPMSLVIDALDAPLADRAHVHCLSDGSRPRTLAELGRDARRAASWLAEYRRVAVARWPRS